MAADQPQGQPSSSSRDPMALGLRVEPAVTWGIATTIGLLFGVTSVLAICSRPWATRGTPIDASRARQIVLERSHVLRRVVALAERLPLPTSADPACRALATELGALDIRIEDGVEGPWVIVAFSRSGVAETYETQLTWVPESAAERVRTGGARLGEEFEYLGGGWWWVFW